MMSPRRLLLVVATAPLVLAACSGATPGSSASPSATEPPGSIAPSGSIAPGATAPAASPVALSITIPGPSAPPPDTSPALAVMRTRLSALGVTDAATGLSIDGSGIHFTGVRPSDVPESLVRAVLTDRGAITIVGLPEATYGTSDAPRSPASGTALDPSTVTPLADLSSGGTSATPTTDAGGGLAVEITLSTADARAIADYTGAHVNGFIAVLVDGRVYVAPVIQSAISGGSLVITGGAADGDVRLISALLASGTLPPPFGQ